MVISEEPMVEDSWKKSKGFNGFSRIFLGCIKWMERTSQAMFVIFLTSHEMVHVNIYYCSFEPLGKCKDDTHSLCM